MLKVQFDGNVLGVRPNGLITREEVATLTRAADEYLGDHPKIAGVMDFATARPACAFELGRDLIWRASAVAGLRR